MILTAHLFGGLSMKRFVQAAAAASALLCAGMQSSAALDLGPLSPSFGWKGAYAGVQLGAGRISTSTTGTDTSYVGGVHAGYLWQMGQFAIGPEIEANRSNWEVSGTSVDAIVHTKLRAGIVIDRALLSAAIGYGHLWASTGALSGNDGGLSAGAGIDVALSDTIIGGVDYLYHRVRDFDSGGANLDMHSVRARLSYKYN
jgi:opacity protein-like surface antigen